ncbi:hypothetical protein BVRB_2g041750 [Beta vulgaris subsp. vulgaris]|nr:hypothetical protein BVRB_2g041750 [Beta vulgaris subsp. vulgaris]
MKTKLHQRQELKEATIEYTYETRRRRKREHRRGISFVQFLLLTFKDTFYVQKLYLNPII